MKISTASMPTTAAERRRGSNPCPATVPPSLFQILDARRQRARAQDHGQILGLLLVHAAAADFSGIADGLFNVGDFLNLLSRTTARLSPTCAEVKL
jgi:hypothetical protein